MRYWLRISGTNENPEAADWQAQASNSRRKRGDVSMFSRRPRIGVGDRLVLYAAGSPAAFGVGRFYAIVEVAGNPRPSSHERWPWEVPTTMVIAGPRLERCPTIDQIELKSTSVRRQSHIRLTDEQGRHAEELLAATKS
jgi:hypothetical protein